MYRKNFLPYALTAVLTLATACGGSDDDTTAPTGDTPTEAEVTNMVAALSAISSSLGIGFDHASDPRLAAQTISLTDSGNCPNGGTFSYTGNYTIANQTQNNFTYNYNVTQTYNQCKANGNGTVFTFDGEGLTLSLKLVYTASPLSYTYEFHETGNIGWAGNGKNGSCAVNITLNYTFNGSAATNYNYSGTYCGRSINS